MTTVNSVQPPKNRRGAPKQYLFTKENASEMGRRGALKSNESQKRIKTLREALLAILERPGEREENNFMEAALALIESAKQGDPNAFAKLRDSIGEVPVQKVEDVNETKITDALIASRQRGSNDD